MSKKPKIVVFTSGVLLSIDQLQEVILNGGADADAALESYREWLRQNSKLIMKSDLDLGEWLVENGHASGVCIYCRLGLIQGTDHCCPLGDNPTPNRVQEYIDEINWISSVGGETPYILS